MEEIHEKKSLYFIRPDDGLAHPFEVSSYRFIDDDGVAKLKFVLGDGLSKQVIQRLDEDSWKVLEGDFKEGYLEPIGKVIRANMLS